MNPRASKANANRNQPGIVTACMTLMTSILAASPAFSSEDGPLQSPLTVVRMLTGDTSDRIYVEFNAGAMPGCYADSGGRLYKDDPFFSQTYALLLTLVATGGKNGRVIFVNENGSGRSVGRILGLDVRP